MGPKVRADALPNHPLSELLLQSPSCGQYVKNSMHNRNYIKTFPLLQFIVHYCYFSGGSDTNPGGIIKGDEVLLTHF